MQKILDKPGFISINMGSERLRDMFLTRRCPFFFPRRLRSFTGTCNIVAHLVSNPCLTTTVDTYRALTFFPPPEFAKLDINRLSLFALACTCGNYDVVREV